MIAEDPTSGDFWVSPHIRRSDLDEVVPLDQKIEVFADGVRGWQLDPAGRLIAADPHAGLATLSIVMHYFETVGKYREGYEGWGDSERHFRLGFQWVFPEIDATEANWAEAINLAWRQVRNGLYHSGLIGPHIILGDYEDKVVGIGRSSDGRHVLALSPRSLVRRLQYHFTRYVLELRDPANQSLRANFLTRFNDLNKGRPKSTS